MAIREEEETRTPESLRTWLRLLSCEAVILQRLRTLFRKHFHVTLPQFDVLSELEHAHEQLTMSELSKELMVSNGNITGVIDRLVKMGLVQRERPEHDRRIQHIQLTDLGSKEFRRMAKQHAIWITQLFHDVSLADLRKIQSLVRKTRQSVIENIDRVE